MWWHVFVDKWNGISLAWDLGYHSPEIILYSDTQGFGALGAMQRKTGSNTGGWYIIKACPLHQNSSSQ